MGTFAADAEMAALRTAFRIYPPLISKVWASHDQRISSESGAPGGITVADDFAHHPTELTATLSSAMEMGFRKVWAVFQPHTFSRTALLLDDFAKALSIPDVAIISEILPVRETNTYNIYNTDLGAKVEGSVCIDTFEDITKYIVEHAQEDDLVITLGGGNVYMCANMILKALKTEDEA